MEDDTTTKPTGAKHGRSDVAEVLGEFADTVSAFAGTIRTAADSVDRLESDTRGRVIDAIASRAGTVGDLLHVYRQTLNKLRKVMR